MVCINSTLLFTLPTMPYMAKGVKVVYEANKSKPIHWLPWPLRLIGDDGCIELMDSIIADAWQQQLIICN